jgi:hypothetical protein
MRKDVDIKITETKSVQSVSYKELYISLRDKFRIIEKLDLEFPNDNDFGRNLRKLLKYGE